MSFVVVSALGVGGSVRRGGCESLRGAVLVKVDDVGGLRCGRGELRPGWAGLSGPIGEGGEGGVAVTSVRLE